MQSAPSPAGSTACADADAVGVDEHELARLDLAHEARRRRGRARTSRRRRRGRRRAGRARAAGSRAGRGTRRASRRRARRRSPRPRAVASRRATASSSGALVVGDQRGDHLGVGASMPSGFPSSSRSCRGVDEVAVVPERDRARAAVVEERLRVRPRVAAGRRVARVPDRELRRGGRRGFARRRPAARARGRAAPSAGRPRRRRSRPTPARGAAARRARSR